MPTRTKKQWLNILFLTLLTVIFLYFGYSCINPWPADIYHPREGGIQPE